ncbi:MAG: hypothetical protein ACI9F9_001352, partial [Candidatus Paceibacteria bacterium]
GTESKVQGTESHQFYPLAHEGTESHQFYPLAHEGTESHQFYPLAHAGVVIQRVGNAKVRSRTSSTR